MGATATSEQGQTIGAGAARAPRLRLLGLLVVVLGALALPSSAWATITTPYGLTPTDGTTVTTTTPWLHSETVSSSYGIGIAYQFIVMPNSDCNPGESGTFASDWGPQDWQVPRGAL